MPDVYKSGKYHSYYGRNIDHYLDDGETFDYKDGNYLQYQFVADQAGNVTWNVVNNGYKNPYEQIIVRVLGEELC